MREISTWMRAGSCFSDGGDLHDVPDHELLVIGDALGAAWAVDKLDVTTTIFVTSVISPLRAQLLVDCKGELEGSMSANKMHFIIIYIIWSFLLIKNQN